MSVDDVELESAATARVGEAAGAVRERARGAGWVLLLDAQGRPQGWIAANQLQGDAPLDSGDAGPASPIFTRESTLRDALSELLASAVQIGVVVDKAGQYQGTVSLEAVGTALRAAVAAPTGTAAVPAGQAP